MFGKTKKAFRKLQEIRKKKVHTFVICYRTNRDYTKSLQGVEIFSKPKNISVLSKIKLKDFFVAFLRNLGVVCFLQVKSKIKSVKENKGKVGNKTVFHIKFESMTNPDLKAIIPIPPKVCRCLYPAFRCTEASIFEIPSNVYKHLTVEYLKRNFLTSRIRKNANKRPISSPR